MEWLDPIFVGGHWTPALIEMAGATHTLNPATGSGPSAAAGKSFAVPNQAMVDLDPDIIIISPCGLDLQASTAACTSPHAPTNADDDDDDVFAHDADVKAQ